MCGRYGLFHSTSVLREIFELEEEPNWSPRYNIPPGEDVLVVGENPAENRRSARRFRWGLIPFWVDVPEDFGANLINARLETAHEKPSFRVAFQQRRCLIPASGFYEWTDEDPAQPYFFTSTDEGPLALAGLWERWEGEEDIHYSCTILTRPAGEAVREVHHRMPVLLEGEDRRTWLDGEQPADRLREKHLETEPSLRSRRVSQRVNNPGFDEPACVEAVD